MPSKPTSSERTPGAEPVRGSNQTGLRAHNERLVLSLIRQTGPLAKAEIARRTGLSAQTVSVIMRRLEGAGLLVRGAPLRGRVGQPSVPMGLAPEGAFFLGLKIGRRSLDLLLIDFLGTVRARAHRYHRYPSPDGVIAFTDATIPDLLDRLTEAQRSRVAGLGIAMPFRLWAWARPLGVTPRDMADWQERDIAADLRPRWPFPVYLQNDGSAACGAELVFGTGNRPRDFFYFSIGFFVGGGLVLDNVLHTGPSGNAAALGSMPIDYAGSRPRQLVDVASLAVLERALADQGLSDNGIWEDPQHWPIPEAVLESWIESAAEGLARAIVAAASVVDAQAAIIDGWMPAEVRAALVARTATHLGALDVTGIDPPPPREGTIGCDARTLGAASLPLSERYLVDRNAFMKS